MQSFNAQIMQATMLGYAEQQCTDYASYNAKVTQSINLADKLINSLLSYLSVYAEHYAQAGHMVTSRKALFGLHNKSILSRFRCCGDILRKYNAFGDY